MIHHVIFRVTSDESDDVDEIASVVNDVDLGADITCVVTQDYGFIEFDFGIDLDELPVPLPIAARSTASAYLMQIFVAMNMRYMENQLAAA